MIKLTLGRLSLAIAAIAFATFMSVPALLAANNFPDFVRIKSSDRAQAQTVKIGLGKSLVVDLPQDVRDILVADPTIADAIVRTARRVYLIGKAVGQTNVLLFDGAGSPIVSVNLEVERDITGLEDLLDRNIPDSEITVEIINDNLVLTGSVETPADARRAVQLATIYVTGGEATTGQFAQQASGQGDVAIDNPDSERQTSQIINLLKISGDNQVHLKVTVAEVRRSVIKQLGLDISSRLKTGSIFSSLLTGLPMGANNLGHANISSNVYGESGDSYVQSALTALNDTGLMKTLAEPTLTAVSGQSANFLVGGEFPVPTGQSFDDDGNRTITTEFKKYGVSLAFTPVVLSPGRISLRINTEVSELSKDGAFTLSGGTGNLTLPGLRVRRASTTLELPSGGSMVLGGLLSDFQKTSVAGVPGLMKLPILGSLFRSRDYQRSETELVIIVTPYLVRPVATTALTRPDKNLSMHNDHNAYLLGKIQRKYGVKKHRSSSDSFNGNIGFIFK